MKFEFMRKDYVAASILDDAAPEQTTVKQNTYREICINQKPFDWIGQEKDKMLSVGYSTGSSLYINLNGFALLENSYSEKQFKLLLSNAVSMLELNSERLPATIKVKDEFRSENNVFLYSNQQNVLAALEEMKIHILGQPELVEKPNKSILNISKDFRWPWQKDKLVTS